MKTRRGFFAALVGAVAAPVLLAKSGVAKVLGEKKTTPELDRATIRSSLDELLEWSVGVDVDDQQKGTGTVSDLIERAMRIIGTLEPEDPLAAYAKMNQMIDDWNEDGLKYAVTKGTGWLYRPEPEWWYDDFSVMKLWPEPPVYPVHFKPWPWEHANWHRLGRIPLERIVTITNQDGTTSVATINQERGNS